MVFMFIMYRGRPFEGSMDLSVNQFCKNCYLLHCAHKIANREDPYHVAVNILSKFRMNKNT